MFHFDEFGYLTPYGVVPASFEEIEAQLVFNVRRQDLYRAFRNFVADLAKAHIEWAYIWVNGSFSTLKKYPKDIDLVVFIPFENYAAAKKKLTNLAKTYADQLDIFYEATRYTQMTMFIDRLRTSSEMDACENIVESHQSLGHGNRAGPTLRTITIPGAKPGDNPSGKSQGMGRMRIFL